jgi:hypothetical protein
MLAPGKQDQRAEIVDLHLGLQLLQPVLAEPIEVHAHLPVRTRLAVEPPWIVAMRAVQEGNIHPRRGVDFPLIPSHKITSHRAPFS